jgi:hypothetical protein
VDERTQERFWSRVDKTGECWLWTGGKSGGYGAFSLGGKTRLAHRVVYEMLVGPVAGIALDHMCHNRDFSCPGSPNCPHRACVNPAHLKPATARENAMRSPLVGAKTHCKHGHEFTKENRYVSPHGVRYCRTCHREADARSKKGG